MTRSVGKDVMGNVSVEVDGESHAGTYAISKGMISVRYSRGGSKSTQLGNAAPKMLAEMLLLELVSECANRSE